MPEQAKKFADRCEPARIHATCVAASREVVNRAAEYKLRAERRLGQVLAKRDKAPGGEPHKRRKATGSAEVPVETLADVGISKKLNSQSQKLPLSFLEEPTANRGSRGNP